MAIYEFFCRNCGTRSSVLALKGLQRSTNLLPTMRESELGPPSLALRCTEIRGSQARIVGNPSNLGTLDEDDPQSAPKLMKYMGRMVGEGLHQDIRSHHGWSRGQRGSIVRQ